MLPGASTTRWRLLDATEHAKRQRAQVISEGTVDGLARHQRSEHERTHDHLEGELGIGWRGDLAPLDGALDELAAVVVALGDHPSAHRLAQLGVALDLPDQRLHEADGLAGERGAALQHEGP